MCTRIQYLSGNRFHQISELELVSKLSSCNNEWEFSKFVSGNSYSKNFIVCRDSKCDYTGKVIPLKNANDKSAYNESILQSLIYQETKSDPIVLGVYDYYPCDISDNHVGVIISEKLDGTLRDLLDANDLEYAKPIMDLAFRNIRRLNKLGILHRNINIDNIGYIYIDNRVSVRIINLRLAIENGYVSPTEEYNWFGEVVPTSYDAYPNFDIESLNVSINEYYKRR